MSISVVQNIEEHVKQLLKKTRKSNIAIFKIDNYLKSVSHPSKQFDTMLADFPLCGVYNAEATVEMVMEDVNYVNN